MAKDVSNKPASSTNSSDSNATSTSAADQQKVPPLRIVLNTAGNQKSASSSSTPANNNQQTSAAAQSSETKKEKSKDTPKTESGAVKSGGRVRIRLGTNKQVCKSSDEQSQGKSEENNSKASSKSKETTQEQRDSSLKEDIAANSSHLRRITRRSNRSIQAISNEDEESISSMTSVDENQSTVEKTTSDNNGVQETPSSNSTNSTTAATSVTTTTSSASAVGATNSDTPRRKRRKGETSESQSNEIDIFGLQNYKVPNQNSFELYKNIRKQVDKKLKGLNKVNPRAPYGFRDYMLNRGSYLLEGYKLGNGMSLSTNEDGGMHLMMPMGKYHALKYHRINYLVPNRAKVPPTVPVSSPLYNLFVEQEKERYRMRIQHIKEREKLTLAAEQEIMRVYNQAALAAANQNEPFSVCTMLKHQEVYNYLDSDGVLIQTAEDAQQDQQSSKPDGVRTRRRQHEHISPPPTTAKKSAETESNQSESKNTKEVTTPTEESKVPNTSEAKTESKDDKTSDQEKDVKMEVDSKDEEGVKADEANVAGVGDLDASSKKPEEAKTEDSEKSKTDETVQVKKEQEVDEKDAKTNNSEAPETKDDSNDDKSKDSSKEEAKDETQTKDEKEPVATMDCDGDKSGLVGKSVANETAAEASVSTPTSSSNDEEISEEEKRAQERDVFLDHLQQTDDKWDKIRREMLIRHRNEAESLHAVQKLEWEWKAKEIGDCDVRTTPIIDNILVPKLNIISQDY